MRDTRKTLLISGGLAIGGVLMGIAGLVLKETQGETPLRIVLIAVGWGIAPLSIFAFINACVSGLRKEALEQGKNEIARWKLTPAEWAAFREQDVRWTAAGRAFNMMHSGAYRDGEVIFATRAVILEGGFHELTPGGLIDLIGVEYLQGAPSCLEFTMRAQKTQGASGTGFGFNYITLRVPVSSGETRQAMKVLAHYNLKTKRGVSIAMRHPAMTIRVSLGVAAACAIAAIWGFSNRETQVYGVAPLIAAILGVIVGGVALLLAASVAFRVRETKVQERIRHGD